MTYNARIIPVNSFLQDHLEVLIQLLFWIFFLLTINVDWQSDWLALELPEAGIRPLSALIFPLSSYINTYFLIPSLLKKKKWWQYGIAAILSGLFFELMRSLYFVFAKKDFSGTYGAQLFEEFMNFRNIMDPVFYGILFSCAYVFTKDWILNIGLVEKLRAEKLSTELAFLKSQVDPHFLFNTLNTLYALALEENGHKTADAIAKLGTLLRYSLHDSRVDFIPLAKEVVYIQEYLALQRLRITPENRIELRIASDMEQWQQVHIAPMVLLPFIENAFKYGISPAYTSFIGIEIRVEEGKLFFQIENSIFDRPKTEERSGLGIENVRQRLNFIYPGQYELSFGANNHIFRVNLILNLPA